MPFIKGSEFVKIYKEILIKHGFYDIPFISISRDEAKEDKKYFESILHKPIKLRKFKYLLDELIKINKFNH
jgi:hypothetical protein